VHWKTPTSPRMEKKKQNKNEQVTSEDGISMIEWVGS
jgi:hypothetical protein